MAGKMPITAIFPPRPMAIGPSWSVTPPVPRLKCSLPKNRWTMHPPAAVVEDGTVFRQIEFVGILKGTTKRALAEKLVDFMLSKEFQEDIPLNMFVFPANNQAVLPEVFQKYARKALHPVEVPAEAIEKNREEWIEKWTETRFKVKLYRFLLALPPLLFLAVFYFYPLVKIMGLSLTPEGGQAWDAFVKLFSKHYYLRTLWFTTWQAALSHPADCIVGPARGLCLCPI